MLGHFSEELVHARPHQELTSVFIIILVVLCLISLQVLRRELRLFEARLHIVNECLVQVKHKCILL